MGGGGLVGFLGFMKNILVYSIPIFNSNFVSNSEIKMSKRKATGDEYTNDGVAINSDNWYLQPKVADVRFTFSTQDGKEECVPAHKMLLATVSDVFDRMFYGEMRQLGDIAVVDASSSAFKEFLQFFYKRQVKLTEEYVVQVMNLGHQYNVVRCEEAAVQFMKKILTQENMCDGLEISTL